MEKIIDNKNGTYSFVRDGQTLHTGKWGDNYVAPKAVSSVIPNNKPNVVTRPGNSLLSTSKPSENPTKFNLFDFQILNPSQSMQTNPKTPVGPFKGVVGQTNTPIAQPTNQIQSPALPNFAEKTTQKFQENLPTSVNTTPQPKFNLVSQASANQPINDTTLGELQYDVTKGATIDEVKSAYPEFSGNDELIGQLHYDLKNGATIEEIKGAYPELFGQAQPQNAPTDGTHQFQEYIPMAKAGVGKFTIDENGNPIETVVKTIGNIPGGVYNMGAGALNLAANFIPHPIDTTVGLVKGVYGAVKGGIEQVGENYQDGALQGTSKTLGQINKLIGENPVETLGLVKPKIVTKGSAKLLKGVVSKPLKGAGYIASEALGKTTGTSGETIRTAFKQGGTTEFKSALRGNTTAQDILSNTKEGLQTIKDNRASLYGEDYVKLQANKTLIKLNQGEKGVLPNVLDSLKKDYKVGVIYDKKGAIKGLDFSQSKITGGTSQGQIESIVRDLKSWKDTTPEGLDVLKQRIQDYYRGTADSAKGDRISTMVSNTIKNNIIEQVPEYKTMVAKYEKLTTDIRDITKTLSLGDKTMSQTAITKLNSVLRDNFPARQDMVKVIEQYTGKNLQAQIAGSSLNAPLAKGLAGVITGGGIVFGQLANPGFWAGLALASPRLIGELASTIGTPVAKITEAITNIKKYGNNIFNPTLSNLESSAKPLLNKVETPKQSLLKQAWNNTKKSGNQGSIGMGTRKLGSGGKNITNDELRAIRQYSASGFEEINKSNNTNVVSKLINNALDKVPSYKGTVYRGSLMETDKFNNLKVGQVLDEKGFISTSTRKNVADSFVDGYEGNKSPYTLILHSKNGKDISKYSSFPGEGEVLFKPGMKYKIDRINKFSSIIEATEL